MKWELRIRQILRLVLLGAFALGALAGCAILDDVGEKPVAPVQATPRKPASRELGSLWSEDSNWNHVYTASASRVTGDIITIRLDDSFKRRVVRMHDGQEEAQRQPASGKSDDAAKLAAIDERISGQDLAIRGVIEEVGPRGIYRISAADTLRLGQWEPYIMMKGRVRDKDISINDEIRVADVVDMNYELMKAPPGPGERKEASDVSW